MSSKDYQKTPELNVLQIESVFLALIFIAISAYSAVHIVEQRYQHTVEGTLSTVLETMAEALELWEQDQRLTVQNLANRPAIRSVATKLLALPRNHDSLLAADAQQQLRQLMQPVLDHYRGYFIIAPDNISLASSRDANIGTPNLLNKHPEILADIWGGVTRLTPVQRSDVPLTTEVGKQPQPGDETLFVATPIRDDNGRIIALFTLRIDPYKSLFTITNKGRLGESGESYLFDSKGLLLSRSRFDDQLVRIGLLSPGQSSATNLPVRDPGLFKPFVQGEGETTRRFGGTGLGLAITKRLVEMMDGYIELESTPGEGSAFTVHLTLEETTELPQIKTSNLEGIKVVLLTSDEAATILSNYLCHAGAEVVLKDADGAVAMCKEECTINDEYVVLIDTRGDIESSISLRGTLRKQNDDIDRRFLMVERGNRRYARPYEEDGMTLDLNAMRRRTLLNAVAALTGRESPEQCEPSPIQQFPGIPQSVDEARAHGRLILLADDNPTNRKVISQQLGMLGYLVETADDGAEALEMWRNGDYTLILTDCHMPVTDGYQFTQNVRREEPPESRMPIIATTADALKGTGEKCLNVGMDDYLTKPMKLHELRETLERWTPMGTSEDKTVTKGTSAQVDSEIHEEIDPTALGKILGTQDPEVLADCYNDFLDSNAPTAQRIEEAFQKEDMAEISALAHKLKSAACTVGANVLADCCQALEAARRIDNVADALKLMSTTKPTIGLVICDLNMPGVDGLELLKRFDEMAYCGDILILSGEDAQTLKMAEALAHARGLSVIGSIAKPIQAETLSNILSQLSLHQRNTKKASAESMAITPEMLASAIEAGELKPWFQPKIEIANRIPVGVEVLARWPESSIGPIFPDTFIPVAEAHGLIDMLTFSLVEQAIKIDQGWRQQDIVLEMAVNISMNSLYDEGFPDKLEKHVLKACGSIDQIKLEVTETQLMEDLVRPLEALLRLRMKKVKLVTTLSH
jgi:CheY-like chemotaxis protein